jgi:hypothetical protein
MPVHGGGWKIIIYMMGDWVNSQHRIEIHKGFFLNII